MYEAIDATVESDEYAKVGDRLDLTGDLVAAIDGRRKLGPRNSAGKISAGAGYGR